MLPVCIVIVTAYFDLVFGFHAARLPRDTDHALAAVRIALAADSIVIVFTFCSRPKCKIYKHIVNDAAILGAQQTPLIHVLEQIHAMKNVYITSPADQIV